MSNPQLGTPELIAAQAQPEVTVNAMDRSITAAVGGEIVIDFELDDDYTLQATDPPEPDDEWSFATIVMTDTGTVLTGPVDVIYPDVDGLYGGPSRLRFMFVNETLEELTIKRSGQPGVTVPAGESRLVRHAGADIAEVAAAGGGGSVAQAAPVVELPGDTYTLDDLTPGAWHEFTSAAAVTLTIMDDDTEPVDDDAEFGLMCAGAGGITIVEDNDAVVMPPKGGTLELEQDDFAMLKRRAADVYKLLGETVEA